MTEAREPTLGMLEDQTPGFISDEDSVPTYHLKTLEELPGIRDGLLEDINNVRFLRRVLISQEAGMKNQLAAVEARIAMLAKAKDGYTPQVFNGTTQPECPDCSEESI
jgi:hypothetical protein